MAFVILAALLIGAFRPVLLFVQFGPHVLASYQAVAHLFVGGVFVAWRMLAPALYAPWAAEARRYRSLFWWLCAIEIVCAIAKIAGV